MITWGLWTMPAKCYTRNQSFYLFYYFSFKFTSMSVKNWCIMSLLCLDVGGTVYSVFKKSWLRGAHCCMLEDTFFIFHIFQIFLASRFEEVTFCK